jgi:hypothetical protein
MLSIQLQVIMITIPSTVGHITFSFVTSLTTVNIPKVSVKHSKTGERIPGLNHPIDNWSKAKESEKSLLSPMMESWQA